MIDDVIIIFGFSGAGKSTLANRLAAHYGMRVIHPSGILRDLLEGRIPDIANSQYNQGFWESPEGVKLFKERLLTDVPMDVLADQILLQEVAKGNVVIDSWSLPWLTDKGYKIYLEASPEIRAKRVSLRSGISYDSALERITMKDTETCKMFKKSYGFDIARDHDVFDLKLDTDHLTEEETYRTICKRLIKSF